LENLDIDGRILLKWILNRTQGSGLDSSASGSYEHGNNPPDSETGWEYFSQLSDYQFIKDSVPRI